MSDLDDKLKEIMCRVAGNKNTPDFYVDEIKQAFANAGYVTPENAAKVQTMVDQLVQLAQNNFVMPTMVNVALDKKTQKLRKLITGQEWYDRFNTEVDKLLLQGHLREHYLSLGEIYREAAKRAAGIE